MKPSLVRNVCANYLSQLYITLVGILMVPVYVRYMGMEAYGLVGFFAMLQALFQLLDLGLSPTLARETARFHGAAGDAVQLRTLLRALEVVFIVVGLLGAAAVIVASPAIANHWLKATNLSAHEVQAAIMLMGAAVALRWISGMYRGAISGFECLAWLGSFNSAVATARFILVIPVFVLIDASPTSFFGWQLAVAIVELGVLVWKIYTLVPPVIGPIPMRLTPLLSLIRFSISIAYTTSLWILVTQMDKLLLSRMVSLEDYGYLTLALLAASGVMMIATPLTSAFIPRFNALQARNEDAELAKLYRLATQMVALATGSAAVVIAVFAEQVLWIWTGNNAIAAKAAPILALYAVGYALASLSGMASHLQVAKGKLGLHVAGSSLFLLVLVPTLLALTARYGIRGAAYAWLLTTSLHFLFWVPVVHRRFLPGVHARWLLSDVGLCCATALAAGLILKASLAWPAERAAATCLLIGVTLAVLAIATLAAPLPRAWLRQRLWPARPVLER